MYVSLYIRNNLKIFQPSTVRMRNKPDIFTHTLVYLICGCVYASLYKNSYIFLSYTHTQEHTNMQKHKTTDTDTQTQSQTRKNLLDFRGTHI